MSLVVELLQNQVVLFVLVLARVGAVVLTAPIYNSSAIPLRVRGLLAVTLSMLVTPLYLGSTNVAAGSLLQLSVLVAREAVIGLLLGVGVRLLLTGIQLAGQLISQLSGMALADVFSPGFDASVPTFSQLLFFVTMAVFVLMDGHRMVMEGVLHTFVHIPPGGAIPSESLLDAILTILTESFRLGIRAAAPVMGALLLSTLMLGLISRTLPQVNVLVVGFSFNSLLTLGGLFLSVGAIAWTFQDQTAVTLDLIQNAIAP